MADFSWRIGFGAVVAAGIAVGASVGACGGGDSQGADNPGGDVDAADDGSSGDAMGDGTGTDGSSTDATGFDGAPPVDAEFPCDGCAPFPPPTTPACDPTALPIPKVAYPPNGVLLPPNMNVLEVQWTPSAGATLYDVEFSNSVTYIRVTSPCVAVPDVRGGASRGCGLTLPLEAWKKIADENRDGDPVKITVRATKDGSCISSSTDKVEINFAKEDLAGGIYYWQAATYGGVGGQTGGIYSHDFGTFDPTPTPFYTSGATGTCVGCHTLSRDGARMAVLTDDPDADDEMGDVKSHVMDVKTRTVLGGATMSPGFQTFTHDHTKMIATTFKGGNDQSFAVFDGDGTTKLATRTIGTGLTGTHIDLSRDDKTLVYVVPKTGTIDGAGDHHFLAGSIYTSSFDAAANTFGTATPILPSTGTINYYYPSFSPNGTFLVLNEAAANDAFYNRKARVKLLRYPAAAGAKPIDLPALNVADGLSNSWPRWSPFVQTYKGHKILWLTFSSNRDYGLHLVNKGFDNCYPPEGPTDPLYANMPQPASKKGVGYEGCGQPQIWMAAVNIDEDAAADATDRSFPAFWLPFQDVNSHNHTAQWVEKVLSSPPPPPGDGGTDAAPSCVPAGGGCSSALCCSDVVCCGGTCVESCIK
jgi:hypothetical protein